MFPRLRGPIQYIQFLIYSSKGLFVMLNVCFAPGDSDFYGGSKTVEFKPGEREKPFAVIAINDNDPEVIFCLFVCLFFYNPFFFVKFA